MASTDDGAGPRKRRKTSKAAPYALHSLFDNVPLHGEDGGIDTHITCVELWNDNIYIGTSAAEILHFVSIPPDPSDGTNDPSFILASRLPIGQSSSTSVSNTGDGVQQIVLLPTAAKACILCNGVLYFFILPELSPASKRILHCRWVGGLDLNLNSTDPSGPDPVIMVSTQNRIMLVRMGEEPSRVRNIDFPGCLAGVRRGTIACVADEQSYSLLDVEHRQKIPLFPISSSKEGGELDYVADMPTRSESGIQRSSSASYQQPPMNRATTGHARSTSLNAFVSGLGMRQQSPRPSGTDQRSGSLTPDPLGESEAPSPSPAPEGSEARGLRNQPHSQSDATRSDSQKPLPPAPTMQLRPHIVSPTPSEFLLVTGTERSEPGIGMFVNVDGEIVRGTMDFERFPEDIVVDSSDNSNQDTPTNADQEGYVIAVVKIDEEDNPRSILEIQRWDADPGQGERRKDWIEIPAAQDSSASHVGVRRTISSSQQNFHELGELLQLRRLKLPKTNPATPYEESDPRTGPSIEQFRKEKELFESQELTDSETGKRVPTPLPPSWESDRNKEEAAFVQNLGKTQSNLVLWSGNHIWTMSRNPLPLQLESTLKSAQVADRNKNKSLNRNIIISLVQSIEKQEPKTEAEFLGLGYIKQKAGLLLFVDLLLASSENYTEAEVLATEEVLLESMLDPRIILLFIPGMKEEVIQSAQGIWVYSGLARLIEQSLEQLSESKAKYQTADDAIMALIKRYLMAWQSRRGYGSIADESLVFETVDAALLRLLLQQDITQPSAKVRHELNNLVDSWDGSFTRAIALLEQHHRLFTLSRLYQRGKMIAKVLGTWRRIAEGERDDGNEVTVSGVETKMRKYLVVFGDAQLVMEYGSWLAARNPQLGIQVFADEKSRLKLPPQDIVRLLKAHAPRAVQDYLEYLVFSKSQSEYADDLIGYYLDTVISVLESSEDARASLAESYSTYRALRPPKPSYLNFITENAPPEPWWRSRLRLLQLLGGERSTQFTSSQIPSNLSYSIPAVLARIEPFQTALVSENIILDGRQGRHREALHLLIHGLGDYDSAIRYCIYSGPPSSGHHAPDSTIDTQEAATANKKALFHFLLTEFLEIENLSDRVERTSDLLARFAAWFDVHDVLAVVPDEWSVNILSGFLAHVFRDLVSQRREARIQRSLSLSLNVRVGAEYVDMMEKVWVEDEDEEGDGRHGRGTLRALTKNDGANVKVAVLPLDDDDDDDEHDDNATTTAAGGNNKAARGNPTAKKKSDGDDDDDFGQMVEAGSS